nr:MAG TPA: hypothetical protein [Crassvirales sp.]
MAVFLEYGSVRFTTHEWGTPKIVLRSPANQKTRIVFFIGPNPKDAVQVL